MARTTRAMQLVSGLMATAVIAAVIIGGLLIRTSMWGSAFQPARVDLAAFSARDISSLAGDRMATALGAGGTGFTFDVVQINTLYAKPGGPQILLRSEEDPAKVIAEVGEHRVNAIVSHGGVTADAFWMDISTVRPAGDPADLSVTDLYARVLERQGVIWRDDGDGWYMTDASPGVGMDPATARALPELLRSIGSPTSLGIDQLDGRAVVGTRGDSTPAAFPGVIASDGAAFTEPSFKVETWVDDLGRLVKLVARARNLNQDTFDLITETTITFAYGSPGDPYQPTRTMAPDLVYPSTTEKAEVAS